MKRTAQPISGTDTMIDSVPSIKRQTSVTVQVHAHLRRLILRLQLKPGEALSEKDLSVKLGVSRTPVREAFIRLSEEGLVDIFPQRGTLVAPIRIAEIEEAQFLRDILETAVVRRAAESMDPAVLTQLTDNLQQQQMILQRKDYDAFWELDERFHQLLCKSVSLPRAWRVIHAVKGQLDRVRYISLPEPGHAELVLRQHTEILEAVRDGDVDRAVASMQNHLQEIWVSIERMARENDDIFQS